MERKFKLIVIIILLYMIYPACNQSTSENKDQNTIKPDSINVVSGFGKIGTKDEIRTITPEINGIVKKVLFEEGDSLVRGDTIFFLKTDDIMNSIAARQAGIEAKKTALEITKQSIKTAEKTVETRKNYYDRLIEARKNGSESRQAVENAALQYEKSLGDLETYQLRKEQQQEELESQEIRYQQDLLRLNKHFIITDMKGLLLQLDAEEQSAVQAFQSAGEIKTNAPLSIEAEIDELFAAKVDTGQRAHIVPYGRNDTIAYGIVYWLSPRLNEKSMFSETAKGFMDRRVRRIKINIDSTTEDVLIGERVQVYIDTQIDR